MKTAAGAVKYYRNGALFYTSGQSPSYSLRAAAALNQQGAALGEVVMAAAGAGGADVRWMVNDQLGTPQRGCDG